MTIYKNIIIAFKSFSVFGKIIINYSFNFSKLNSFFNYFRTINLRYRLRNFCRRNRLVNNKIAIFDKK